jgi:hypothetical protein
MDEDMAGAAVWNRDILLTGSRTRVLFLKFMEQGLCR